MGAILCRRAQLVGAASETVGYKSGIALSRENLVEHTKRLEIDDWWVGDDNEELRIRAEEFSEAIELLLHAVGNIPGPIVVHPVAALSSKYHADTEKWSVAERVLGIFKQLGAAGVVDHTTFRNEVVRQLGSPGAAIAEEFLAAIELYEHANPFSRVRRVGWRDRAELKGLFESASLETQYGTFFDQRYIDYLAKNFGRIDEIHWRKFEGLTAEFLVREGWRVEIGPGQGDGGVDVRAWRTDADATVPPAMLVQCKRQKSWSSK